MWDGMWILGNAAKFKALPAASQDLIRQHFDEAAQHERADILRLDQQLKADLQRKGLEFLAPNLPSFKEKLIASPYYKTWSAKFDKKLWETLEAHTGKLV